MSIFRRSGPNSLENPNVPITGDQLAGLLGVGLRTASGIAVTEDSALRLVPVLACIRLIAETVAALPLGVFVKDGRGRRQVDGPRWFEQPNDEMDQQEFVEDQLGSVLSNGNGFNQLIRATSGRETGDIQEIWPIAPQHVDVVRNAGRRLEFRTPDATGLNGKPMTSYHCLHIRGFRKTGQPRALSPIQYHRQAIGLALAAEQFGAQFFGQGAHASGVIKVKGDITLEQAKIMLATWKQNHGGLANAHEPGMLTNDATWESISIPPNDAQFLETRGYQTAEVARIYRVPPHLIGDVEKSTSWGTGIEEQNTQFVVFTLTPWIVRFERAFTRLLPPGQFARFNVSGLLRGAMKDRYASYAIGRQWGWLSVNDILGLEDSAAVGGGDTYLSPLNMIDANDMAVRPLKDRAQAAYFLGQAGLGPAVIGATLGIDPAAVPEVPAGQKPDPVKVADAIAADDAKTDQPNDPPPPADVPPAGS